MTYATPRALEKQLQTELSLLEHSNGEQIVRKPTSRKTADYIERLLEGGKKTMRRADLVDRLVEQKLVGGKDENRREQYANEAIRLGIMYGYLKEDRSGTVHWVPGIRKSRVTKKL